MNNRPIIRNDQPESVNEMNPQIPILAVACTGFGQVFPVQRCAYKAEARAESQRGFGYQRSELTIWHYFPSAYAALPSLLMQRWYTRLQSHLGTGFKVNSAPQIETHPKHRHVSPLWTLTRSLACISYSKDAARARHPSPLAPPFPAHNLPSDPQPPARAALLPYPTALRFTTTYYWQQ